MLWGIDTSGVLSGYSQAEAEVIKTTDSLPSIIENFLFYPYYFLIYILRFILDDGIFVARLVSVLMIMGACGCLLFIIRRKFGVLMSIIGVCIFALNSWIMQIARSATPESSILFFGLALITIIILIREDIQNQIFKILGIITYLLCWFIPLLPWFLSGFLFYHLYYYNKFKRLFDLKFRIIIFCLVSLIISLMVFSFTSNNQIFFSLLGVPNSLPSLGNIINNFFITLRSIFWQAPLNPARWLGNLPFLDIFTASFILFGIYSAKKNITKSSFRSISIFLTILLVIASINDNINTLGLEFMLAIIILIVVAGLNEFLTHWKKLSQ